MCVCVCVCACISGIEIQTTRPISIKFGNEILLNGGIVRSGVPLQPQLFDLVKIL